MNRNKKLLQVLVATISILVLAALIWPVMEQRNASADKQTLRDFTELGSQIEEAYSEDGRIPDDIDDLDQMSEDLAKRAKKRNYTIERDSARSYRLCADFKTDTAKGSQNTNDEYGPVGSSLYRVTQETHKAGYDCIEYDVYGYGAYSNYTDDLIDFGSGYEFSSPSSPVEEYPEFDISEFEQSGLLEL